MTGKIFTFEGVDRAGKTTLIHKVSELTDIEVISIPRPAENGWEATVEWNQGKIDFQNIINQARENPNTSYLMDRFSYSELVYCSAFNRPCDFKWYEEKIQENRDKLRLILVDELTEVLIHRWERENMPEDSLHLLMEEYEKLPVRLNLEPFKDFIRVFSSVQSDIDYLVNWIHGQNTI